MDIEIEDNRSTSKLTADATLTIQVTSVLSTTPDRIEISATVDCSNETANTNFDSNRQSSELLLKPTK